MSSSDPVFPFPGRIVKVGDAGPVTVLRIQERLNAVGCGPLEENGIFDQKTENAVKLFQMRFSDVSNRPLEVDGEVGSITWGALFGAESVPSSTESPSKLIEAVINFAKTQIGIREKPLGSNRGTEVDEYLRTVGIDPKHGGKAWCVAFTYYCYAKAANDLAMQNPHIKTAGVLDHWHQAQVKPKVICVKNSHAIADPSLVQPGSLFIIDHGGGLGHSGLVIEVSNGRLVTIEGNTNDDGSRNGIGVFNRDARKISKINKGFIDYSSF
ncbi:MAG: peptidoglycan-binding domain-containing protein [Candidatus Methylumidiphilus sp.]